MSLLSNERLLVAIHERGIDALRLRRGRLPRSPFAVVERQRFDVGASGNNAANSAPWQRSVSLLGELAGNGTRQLHLVLSNHFVRYQLLPWEGIVACNGDTQALAHARLRLAFGETAAAWQIAVDTPRFRTASLAAAIDGRLLASANEMAAAAGLQIASARPHLLSARATLRRPGMQTPAQAAGWFAVFEPGRLTVLRSARGRVLSLHNIRLHAPEALLSTLHQCVAADRLASAQDGDVCLHAPGWSGSDGGMLAHIRLDGQGPDNELSGSDFGQAMAWCGRL